MPYEEEDACMSSVSTTPCRVTPPLRARAPAYDGEYYTPTLRLAMWHAFAVTRGLKPPSVRPNRLAALRRRAPWDVPPPLGERKKEGD